jgi:hypothetical protein
VYETAVYAVCSSRSVFKTAPELGLETSLEDLRKPSRRIQPSQHQELSNPVLNSIVALANETARAGYGTLIFCSSRAGCESYAILISQVMPESRELPDGVLEGRKDLLGELRSTANGVDRILERTIPREVAFHRSLPLQRKSHT